jgi:hypothetical protein
MRVNLRFGRLFSRLLGLFSRLLGLLRHNVLEGSLEGLLNNFLQSAGHCPWLCSAVTKIAITQQYMLIHVILSYII